jgi:hypothetical protein
MSERERGGERRVCCFCKHWKFGERHTEGVCGALSVLEVYLYIYIYICISIYSEREREMARRVVWCVVIA